jgi:uncharacterized membrane protein
MSPSPMHYLPLTPPFMLLLFIVLAVVVALVELRVLTYAYEKLGIDRRYILGILLLSLFGSAVNIPVAELPANEMVVEHAMNFFGVWYAVPEIVRQGQTVLAVNLGGALIPLALSAYLLIRRGIYVQAAVGIGVVAIISHLIARPVPGVGIAVPTLLLPVVAVIVALAISRKHAAPLAYIAGSMGCLLGADVLNLNRIQELGAPIVSIGGAGISDGVFLTGIVAVLLA